ncbi:fungal-specific transcription factor domain-containing protein [Aspergillus floccosus]
MFHESSSQPSTSSPQRSVREGYYQCSSCRKSYARADHLIRHLTITDTREKPYVCQVCNKGFARPRCREKGLICDWPLGGNEAYAESPAEGLMVDDQPQYEPLESTQPQASYAIPIDQTEASRFSQSSHDYTPQNGSLDNYIAEERSNLPAQEPASVDFNGLSPIMDRENGSGIFSVDGTFFPDFIPDSLIPSLARNDFDPFIAPQEYTGTLDPNVTFNFDFTDVDFGLIDFFNTQGVQHSHAADVPEGLETDSGIALGAEAYQRSSLSAWKPAHSDHAFIDEEGLSVPKSIDSPETSMRSERQMLSERLSPGSRDHIFGLVLQTSTKGNLTRIMKSFPSTELLDSLIQDYFEVQSHQIDSWIHRPTFHPNEQSPDMLAAVAAAGAVRSTIPTLRKLGYALMEIVRLRMSDKYERDNTTTRDLRASQTYALVIDIGMWSGDRRRTEIAESFQQPLVTMLRRGLRFRRCSSILPNPEDSEETLNKKWRDWVEQESFKRLVHHLFLHDTQSAMMLNVNPLFSYAEMELHFPSIRPLWEAQTATEWRHIYLSSGLTSQRLPSLVDTLHDLSQLAVFQDCIDLQLSAFVLLHGLSALINEYHRLKFISKGSSKHWNALVINSRHQELAQALQHFRMVSHEFTNAPNPEVLLVHEMISMFLHMSLEELQLFAGKEDKREARRVYHSALEWINSIDSRRAIWHAGQVIRSAKAIPPGCLTGSLAVGVYYASLAFWSYSVVFKAKNDKMPVGSPPSGTSFVGRWPTVFLDGEETTDVQRFISLGCGCPALNGLQGPATLDDPGQIMDVVQSVLRAEASHDALPPLVQTLWNLMGGLGNAARSK